MYTCSCHELLPLLPLLPLWCLRLLYIYHLLSSSCCCYYLALLSTNCSCIIVSSWKHFLHFPSFILKVPVFFGWSHFVPHGKRCLQRGLLGPNQGLMMAAADDSSTAASGAELWRIIPRLGVRRKAKAGGTIPGFGALDQQGLEGSSHHPS